MLPTSRSKLQKKNYKKNMNLALYSLLLLPKPKFMLVRVSGNIFKLGKIWENQQVVIACPAFTGQEFKGPEPVPCVSHVTCHLSVFRCQVSGVWCLVSGVWCLVSGVWCQVSGVKHNKTIRKSGVASRWRVCNQWGYFASFERLLMILGQNREQNMQNIFLV